MCLSYSLSKNYKMLTAVHAVVGMCMRQCVALLHTAVPGERGELPERRGHRRVAVVQPVHGADAHFWNPNPQVVVASAGGCELRSQRCVLDTPPCVVGQLGGHENFRARRCAVYCTPRLARRTICFDGDPHLAVVGAIHEVAAVLSRPHRHAIDHAVCDGVPRVLECIDEPRSGAPHLQDELPRLRHRRSQRVLGADDARARQERHPAGLPECGELPESRGHRRVAVVQPVNGGDAHGGNPNPRFIVGSAGGRELRSQRCILMTLPFVQGQLGGCETLWAPRGVPHPSTRCARRTMCFFDDPHPATIGWSGT